ncbi:hypothetical protein [Clostridium sp. BNL1100]|uniref:hypothetical protein n=1 Tax=Clostridium sp. BNL1100 TaxID=755731 RepID=UPI00059FA58D|nr:hypothetical protein [Clostridium sp. BNL1100]
MIYILQLNLVGIQSGISHDKKNALEGMEPALQRCLNQLEQLYEDFETAKAEYEKPWRYEEEYKTKLAR